jgi:hypothetical protein
MTRQIWGQVNFGRSAFVPSGMSGDNIGNFRPCVEGFGVNAFNCTRIIQLLIAGTENIDYRWVRCRVFCPLTLKTSTASAQGVN